MEWSEYERQVMQTVKWCEERKESPTVWATEVGKWAMGETPSPELGQVLVSLLCFQNNTPSLWKFLERAMSSGLLSSLQILSLLSGRSFSPFLFFISLSNIAFSNFLGYFSCVDNRRCKFSWFFFGLMKWILLRMNEKWRVFIKKENEYRKLFIYSRK